MRGCDAIVHLAAVADVNDVLERPARAELINAGGTRVVLEAARAEGVTRVVYASTVWVYGNANGEIVDEEARLTLPGHLYTATKLAGEMYCNSYTELFDFDCTIARFGIPYGPRARAATVLAAFVAMARAGRPLTIHGDGTQSRRFVYVVDLADGVIAALERGRRGRIYNLVGAEQLTVSSIAEAVRDMIGSVPIVHLEGRAGDIHHADVSGERAADELGWKPRTAFAEGVRRYIEWLIETEDRASAPAASTIAGRAAAVVRQEPSEL